MQDLSFYRTNLCHEDLHFRPDSIVRRVLLDYTQECCQHGSSVKSDLLKKKNCIGSYMFKYCDCTKFTETGCSLKGGNAFGS